MANSGFEGTSGANVTTTSEPTLAAVTLAGTATITYDSTQHAHGATSAKMTHSSTSVFNVQRNFDGSTTGNGSAFGQVWARAYIYLTANPTANIRFMRAQNAGADVGWINITTSGKAALVGATGSVTLYTSTNALTLNSWNRIEWMVNSTSQNEELRLFLGTNFDGSTADEDSTPKGGSSVVTGGVTSLLVGQTTGSNPGTDFWVDDLDVSTSAFLGPFVPAVSTAGHLLALTGVGS
jgi:hypothetical protein